MLKVKRAIVYAKYGDLFAELYEPAELSARSESDCDVQRDSRRRIGRRS